MEEKFKENILKPITRSANRWLHAELTTYCQQQFSMPIIRKRKK